MAHPLSAPVPNSLGCMAPIPIREVVSDAIGYWERGRIIYNLVLAAIVIGCFASSWPDSASRLNADLVQRFFLRAVLANVAYCGAYIPDLLAQVSDFRAVWRRHRWVLFVIGLTFAGIIARFVALRMFVHAAGTA